MGEEVHKEANHENNVEPELKVVVPPAKYEGMHLSILLLFTIALT